MNKKPIWIILLVFVLGVSFTSGALSDRLFGISLLDTWFPRGESPLIERTLLKEESVVVDVAQNVSPSVVTVSIELPKRRVMQFSPFGGFSQRTEGGEPQDIGTGFIVSSDGLIVTNKHVVSEDDATYKVITSDDKEYEVIEITRDPSNDLAVIKIDAQNLTPVKLGSSQNLKVGQFVVAIGTALGEFRHTVTTGVVSGLGRGIVAGSAYEGYVEKLDDVIQTDAAINPGNSGGPLLNSSGEVIGVNVAVAAGAQNIGFAIPVDTLKKALDQFNSNGKFEGKPFLGVSYQMISRQTAILNDVPQGAYVQDVVEGSAADKAGIQIDDIISKIDGKSVSDSEDGLTGILSGYKPGDTIRATIWRDGETQDLSVTLSESTQ